MALTKLAEGAEVELRLNDKPFENGLAKAQAKLRAWGTALASIGVKVSAVGGAITAPLLAAVKTATSLGNELYRASLKTGLSVETLSGLKNAAELAGVGLDELLDRLKESGASVRQIDAYAKGFGPIFKTADAKAAASLQNALTLLTQTVRGAVVSIGSALIPELTALKEWTMANAAAAAKWIDEHRALIRAIFSLGKYVAGAGAAMIGLGAAMQVGAKSLQYFGPAVSAVSAAIGALLSPIGLTVAALAALGYWLAKNTETGAKAAAVLSNAFSIIKEDALAAFKGIRDALATGDVELAMKILGASLRLVWARTNEQIQTAWGKAIDWIADKMLSLRESAAVAMLGITTACKLAAVNLVEYFAQAFDDIQTGARLAAIAVKNWWKPDASRAAEAAKIAADADERRRMRKGAFDFARGVINADAERQGGEIGKDFGERRKNMPPSRADEIAAIRAEIAKLEAERDALVGKAQAGAAGANGRRQQIDGRIDDLNKLLAAGGQQANAAIEATFNPFSAGGFGGGQSPVAKLVNVAQQQLKEAKDLVAEMQKLTRRQPQVWGGA